MAISKTSAQSHVSTMIERIAALSPEKRKRLVAQNPLSFSQQRLWVVEQLAPGTSVYNVPTIIPLAGPFNERALESALRDLAMRHETLRTTFPVFDGQPMQLVCPTPDIPLAVHDLRVYDVSDRFDAFSNCSTSAFAVKFDLANGPLIFATAIVIDEQRQYLIIVMHHIVSDGWSQNILTRELLTLYESYRRGQTPSLSPLPLQYRDFAHWQREWFTEERLQKLTAYWRAQLDGYENLILPFDRPRPAVQRYNGHSMLLAFPTTLRAKLKALGDREGATLFMVMLAAFKALLHRYTAQEDIIVGSPIANRNRRELEDLIGFFVNSLVLRDKVKSEMMFLDLLRAVKETALSAYDHQDLPFEKLVEEINPTRDMSRNPIFQAAFAVQNTPGSGAQFALMSERTPDALPMATRFDLEVHVWEAEDKMSALIFYCADLFEHTTIQRLMRHYTLFLEGVAENCERRVGEYPLLSEDERTRILETFNSTQAAYDRDATIHACFEKQVRRRPDAVAVVDGTKQITYSELDRWANGIAQWLHGLGIAHEARIGILADRSAATIAAVLGILKAGAAYLPLDPAFPPQRLRALLEDGDAACVLTDARLAALLGDDARPRLMLDGEGATLRAEGAGDAVASARSLAYVMYTSGSTGTPKGVCVEHRNVVRLVQRPNYATLNAETVLLVYAPLAFDLSTLEMFGPLLNGGKLVLQSAGPASLEALAATIEANNVNTLWLTAGLFHQMVERGPLHKLSGLRQFLAGGDVLQPAAVRRVLEVLPNCRMINGYGPTECTTFAASFTVETPADVQDTVPIGRPLQNDRIYVLDELLQPTPIGVPGELYIGGDGVARGYLNRDALTAERFVADPFSREPGARMYRSGDQACWTEQGTLHFLGRRDGQLKLRGYRIELGEIESVLREHPAVAQAAVAVKKRGTDKVLVGYVVARDACDLDLDAIRAHLRDRLPAYMAPAVLVPLESIPLTPNGKLDRVALPEATGDPRGGVERVAPRTPTEKTMFPIWQRVLATEDIGVEDNFFERGGHSLSLIELISEVGRAFGKEIPLPVAFMHPTIAAMSAWIDRGGESEPEWNGAATHPLVVPIRATGSRLPLFCVPPAGGTSFPYFNMTYHLPASQPVYAFRDPNEVRDGKPCDTVEEMAVYYRDAMRAIQPRGPYHMVGWSFGGIVALEVARLLVREGHEVRLLGLIESVLPDALSAKNGKRPGLVLGNAWRTIRSGIGITLDGYHAIVSNNRNATDTKLGLWARVTRIWDAMAWSLFLKRTNLSEVMSKDAQLMLIKQPSVRDFGRISNANLATLKHYRATPYDGEIVVLHGDSGVIVGRSGEYAQGWDDIALRGVRVHTVEGDHFSIMRNPHARSLAASVELYLSKDGAGK